MFEVQPQQVLPFVSLQVDVAAVGWHKPLWSLALSRVLILGPPLEMLLRCWPAPLAAQGPKLGCPCLSPALVAEKGLLQGM